MKKSNVPTRFMLAGSHFDVQRASKVVAFIEQLRHTKGEWYNKPFLLLDWQKEIIENIFGVVKKDGNRQFTTAYVEIAKKQGKALAIDTPIPTQSGFVLMRDIKVGDILFDECGNACRVIKTTETMYGHDCCRLTFSDGTNIVADSGHKWTVDEYLQDKKPNTARVTLTTAEMFGKVKCKNGCYRYRIPLTKPVNFETERLKINPYLLGVWLGDGRNDSACVCINNLDSDILDRIHSSGIEIGLYENRNNAYSCRLGNGDRSQAARDKSIQAVLRSMGMLNNKHIPQKYLRASTNDRFMLLQGLMDTDGYADEEGQCEFSTTTEALAKTTLELIRSLGYRATMSHGNATLYGKNCGDKWRIQFFGDKKTFYTNRKKERIKQKKTQVGYKTIKSIEKVASVPVKCIAVDSPSHLFLAGEGFTPTHNTELGAALALYMLVADGEFGAEIYSCAADRAQASLIYNVACDMIKLSPALRKRLRVVASQKRVVYGATNSFYQVLSSEAYTHHGINPHAVLYDELHVADREMARVMLQGASDARRQPLNFLITTAGNNMHSIGYETHQKAMDILEGRKFDSTFYPVIYAAADADDWTKESTWKKANPSMGVTVKMEKLRLACESAMQNPAEENSFRQLRLCQWVKQSVRWMPMDKWDKCDFEVDLETLKGRECYGGLDLSSSTDITAFVLVFPPLSEDEKYIVLPYFWVPEETLELRVRRDHVPYDVWKANGSIMTTEGNVVHYGFIEKFIDDLGKVYNIKEIAFDRWGAVQMTQNLEGLGFTVVPFGQGFKDMSPPTKELMKLVLEQKLSHGGNLPLRWMMDNVFVRTDPAANIKMDKEKSTERIDGAVATVMALDRAIRNLGTEESVYNSRGILII